MAKFDNVAEDFDSKSAKILIIGCGGAGNNTITTLSTKGIIGADTIAINTDAKHLQVTKASRKILVGKDLTRGLGAGGYPEIGKKAALESKAELRALMQGVDLVFVTAGLGGGTGTGSAPIVARFAKDMGAIVIGTVTMPFKIEGARLMKAEEGLVELRNACDTVIVIENQKLLELARDQPLKKAFEIADSLIATMIKGITETISTPSMVNLDFADVRAVMSSGGVAAIGIGTSDSRQRAKDAVVQALNHPLVDVDYFGATGALIQVVGSESMRLEEINEIGMVVQGMLDPNAQIKLGARIDQEMQDKIQVITIITGVKSKYILGPTKKAAAKSTDMGIETIK